MEPAINMSARSLQYYVIGTHWASDLEFFRIETAFLHRLLDNYLTGPLDKINVTQLSTTGIKLYQLERYEARVSQMLNTQLRQLELTADDIPENTVVLAATQMRLENLVTTMMFEFQSIKKAILEIIEKSIENNKAVA